MAEAGGTAAGRLARDGVVLPEASAAVLLPLIEKAVAKQRAVIQCVT
jgi:hypothetical protein